MKDISSYIEHTLLRADASNEDIERLVNEAIENEFFGICVNPGYVEFAKKLIQDTDVKLVTVVNFPLASNTIETTLFQTEFALKQGADEIDTVINISELKNKNYRKVTEDIKRTKEVCKNHNLKVILETDLLSSEEIIIASKCAIEGNANFVKTSTGFVKNGVGAKVEDVKSMFETVSPYGLQVKASGGIKTYKDAIELIDAGASRLGTSSGVAITLNKISGE